MSGKKSTEDKKRGRDEILSSPETASSSEEMEDVVQISGKKKAKHQEVAADAFHELSSFAAEKQNKILDTPREDREGFSEEMDVKYQEYQPGSLIAEIQTKFPKVSEEEIKETIDLVDTFFPTLFRMPVSTSTPSVETPSDVEMQIEPESGIPEQGLEILEILKQAHLPTLGLPVKRDKTQAEHQITIFKPENMETTLWDQAKGIEIK